MSQAFNYTKDVFGGTEYMGRGWHQHIAAHAPKFDNYLSLIIPGIVPHPDDLYRSDKEMIVWMHNTPQQFELDKLEILRHPEFLKRLKCFIVPSEEHKRLTLLEIPVKPEQIYVIPNALEPLTYDASKFDKPSKIKLIHTSSPDRGLDVLLNAVSELEGDFRLEIYNNFYPDLIQDYVPDPRVRFFGKTPKATVMEAIESAHIHAYPSTYPETFCMSQVEALSGGLLCVTSDLGALPEVSGGFGYMYPYTEDREEHGKVFVKNLNQALEDVRNGSFDPTAQIEYVNKTYSWDAIKDKWMEFHDLI